MNQAPTFRTGLAALLSLGLLAGCGKDDAADGGAAPGEAGTPETGGVAVVADISDINQPVAILANSQLDGDLAADVMNMVLVRGAWENGHEIFMTASESPMAIARSYEFIGPDSASIRFHMRSDVRWSDGEPLTARDIQFTYSVVRDPALASSVQQYAQRLDSVVVENDSTVVFRFQHRYPEMLAHSSLPPVPEHVFRGTAPGDFRSHPSVLDPAGGRLVTSGPWVIGRWDKGQQVILVHNPNFEPEPKLDRLVYRVIPDPTTRIIELQTGNVDLIKNVASDQYRNLKGQPGLRFEREQKRQYDYIAYNGERFAPFGDAEVRRALTLAIDTRKLIQGLGLEDVAIPARGPYPPILDVADPSKMPPVRYDPEEARRILESKGWRDTNGDGILEKDGQPFRFSLVTNSGNQRRSDAALVAQQAWRQIGVDAQLRQLETNIFFSNVLKKDYEAALGGWNTGLSADFIANLYREGAVQNVTGYSNAAVEKLFDQALVQPTEEAARPYWQQAAAIIARDQPYTWLYYMDSVDAVRDRLKNTRIDSFGPYQNTWEWWIPKAQQRGGAAAVPAAGDSTR
jgi:peptide/nickel transport system substrate-binding protein